MSDLNAPHFHDDDKAREYLEAIRWPRGPVCPHCGSCDGAYRLEGDAHRKGLLKCKDCREQFSVTVGSVFERSKIPLSKWMLATHLLTSSKKGISSHQLHRMLGVTYKTAWFMTHRIRLAMAPGANAGPLGGAGKTVEADETVMAKSRKTRQDKPLHAKPDVKVMTLVERGGALRSVFLDERGVRAALVKHLDDRSRLVTDGATVYMGQTDQHESVDHSKFEWARGDVHTNTLEGFFSILKRGMVGTYQHCDEKHFHRYLAEFDFRYNNRAKLGVSDAQRARNALKGIEGKRLTYRSPDETAAPPTA
jgi:transposase-like protein